VLILLVQTIVATAIPKITDQFHSVSQIGWYGSAFFLTVASFASSWGKLYKYFPLKWTYLVSVFIFELGSLICGMFYAHPKGLTCPLTNHSQPLPQIAPP
jgi:MFS family permease